MSTQLRSPEKLNRSGRSSRHDGSARARTGAIHPVPASRRIHPAPTCTPALLKICESFRPTWTTRTINRPCSS